MVTNALRMPFADWLGHMAACGLAPAGRVIAVYAAVFNITSNGELAGLTGVEGRSLDKWKQRLVANGWVVIPPCRGGRGNGIEVIPAYRSTPVSFTDIKPKKGSKYYPRNFEQTSADIAGGTDIETPANIALSPVETAGVSAETGVFSAGVSSRAAKEINTKIYNNTNNLTTDLTNPLTLEQEAAREGEVHVGSGVFVNCETVRHRDFSISLKGIEMQLCGAVPMDEIKAIAIGHALQWATDLAAGKRDTVPKYTANMIRQSIQKQRSDSAVTDVRKSRASGTKAVRADGTRESEVEKIHRLVAQASDRQNQKVLR